MTRRILVLAGAAVWLAGCAEEPFQLNYPRNNPSHISTVVSRLSKPARKIKGAWDRPMVYIVATRPRGIVAVDLQTGKVHWRENIRDTSSKIVVGRNFIFHRKGTTILMGRNIRTGRVAWQFTFKYGNSSEFYGLAADGDSLYYVVTSLRGRGRGYARWADVVKVDGRTGKVLWRRRAQGPLGAPTARNGMVFVPYRFQYLTVLDGKQGNEIARLKVRHMAADRRKRGMRLSPILLNYAWATPEGLFYGNDEGGVFKLSPRSASGRKKQSEFMEVSLKRMRSVRKRYFWNGYKPSMVSYTAIDRNRLLWRPAAKGAGFASDRAVLQYYRYMFGFKASTGTVKWAYVHPLTQVISSENLGRYIIYIARGGHIVMLDVQNGDKIWELDTKIRTHGATFDCQGWSPPRGKFPKNPPLLSVLKRIVKEPEIQLQDAKIFAISQLVKVKGAEISKILLDIVNAPETPAEVRRVAGKVLVSRASPDSVNIFLRALKTRYDFLAGNEPKGVGVVAKALGRIGTRRAVPLLISHLKEPLTPFSALDEIIHALIKIGDRRLVWPFRQFLLTYRAEPSFRPQVNILNAVVKALIKFGKRDERQLLTFVAEDVHTLPQLKQFIRRELGKSSR